MTCAGLDIFLNRTGNDRIKKMAAMTLSLGPLLFGITCTFSSTPSAGVGEAFDFLFLNCGEIAMFLDYQEKEIK